MKNEKLKTIGPVEFRKLLNHVLEQPTPKRRTLLVQGNPGEGKSEMIERAAAEHSLKVCDLRMILLDVGDLITKIPNPEHTELVEIVAEFLPKGPGWLLFLDELGQAPPETLRMGMQLIHNRRLGGKYRLPDDCAIIAAMNRVENLNNADELEGPLFDRFVYRVNLENKLDTWAKDYALARPNGALIVGYLKTWTNHEYVEDKETQQALVTKRRWSMVMDDVDFVEEIMPPQVAIPFTAFRKKVKMFENIDNYISGKLPFPKEIEDQYALVAAVSCRISGDEKYEQIVDDVFSLKMKGIDEEIKALLVFNTLRMWMVRKGETDLEKAVTKSKHFAKICDVLSQYRYVVMNDKEE